MEPYNHDAHPYWYKDAIIYEVHVRAFADKDGDGIGDFRGLTDKLDYLKDLGVTALWLLPFYPSPLRDDGYDIADYNSIHPSYGTLRDFRVFLREAQRRGLRVITELVINHTSAEHPWFQRARRAPAGSEWREFYVWSDTPDRYQEARIIFKDFEHANWTWDPVARAYYWHRFYSHQPDLNFANPRVREAVIQAMDFWLGLGVDGLRLDAIPYLFEREGTNCENLPETHDFLKDLRRHIDARFPGRMLLAEANQWPEDAVAYFGRGDECHMAFHFPVMPRMFMAIRMEDRFPIVDILEQTPPVPDSCQWAIFLRNHDELTLEMVTDEERDYMYRVYAQDREARINLGIRRRLAPLLGNHRRRIELMNGLLFSLPGTPVLYYGDEIGMGDNIYLGDRNSVRTPMQWSADRNAGFSRANPQRLYLPLVVDPEYHYESLNVENQQHNPHSLLWWTKRLITLRKRFQAFSQGTVEFLYPENRKVLAFLRRSGEEVILVVANLSRFAQYVELDLRAFEGMVPVEMFGRTRFPRIGELPYLLTLGPHSFHWFTIEPAHAGLAASLASEDQSPERLPALTVVEDWNEVMAGAGRAALAEAILAYLPRQRWFGAKARQPKSVAIRDAVPIPGEAATTYLVLAGVEYTEGDPETYVLPLAFAPADHAARLGERSPRAVVGQLYRRGRRSGPLGVVYDPLADPGGDSAFADALLEAIARRRRFRNGGGEVVGSPTAAFRAVRGPTSAALSPRLVGAEQSNSSIIYGDRLILKLYRKIDDGINPDLELGRFLTERSDFAYTPPVAGALEYQRGRQEPITLGLLQGFVPNEGDAWRYTLDELGRFFERASAQSLDARTIPLELGPRPGEAQPLPPLAGEMIGSYLEVARQLGERTAELHLALTREGEDPRFAPERFTAMSQRSMYQSMRTQMRRTFRLLAQRLPDLTPEAAASAQHVLGQEERIHHLFHALVERPIDAARIRCHGDYHLGQVLYTGKEFYIIDFEGEPARSLGDRQIKRSPLRDVAGMVRSFDYAVFNALHQTTESGLIRPEDLPRLAPWGQFWQSWVAATFVQAYLERAGRAVFLPAAAEDREWLLELLVLDKAIYELGYELNHRPDWLAIPLRGILDRLPAAPADRPLATATGPSA
jgi:maltose alpha-D-glucosyltransferase/alpha-amylase